jgi:hypothetical protein
MSEEIQNLTEQECLFEFDNLAEELNEIIKCESLTEAYICLFEERKKFDDLLVQLFVYDDAIKQLYSRYYVSSDERPSLNLTESGLRTYGVSFLSSLEDLSDPEGLQLSDIFRLSRHFFTDPKDTGEIVETLTDRYSVPVSVATTEGFVERTNEFSTQLWNTFNDLRDFANDQIEDPLLDDNNNPLLNLEESDLQKIRDISAQISALIQPAPHTEAAKCAKEVALVEEAMINYSRENLGSEIVDPFVSIEDKLPLLEQLAAAAAGNENQDAGENINLRFTSNFQTFKEQCIFLSQMFHLVDHHKKVERKKLSEGTLIYPYAGTKPDSNAGLIIEGEPFGFVNQLTQYPSTANFFDATNAQIAHLQPMMRFFKITPSNSTDGFSEKSYEFKFDTFASQQDIQEVFTNKNKRGFGAGIKSFNFTYDGSNPFSVKKSIKATLTIYANNFSELIKERGNIRYIDLALKTGTAIRERTGDPELDFRIKAVVGLAVPNGNTTADFQNIMNAVKENYVTLNLTPVTHTFDFDETGAVTFKIDYYAYIEEFLDKARMNIFADNVLSKRVTERRLAYKTAKASCKDDDEILKTF